MKREKDREGGDGKGEKGRKKGRVKAKFAKLLTA